MAKKDVEDEDFDEEEDERPQRKTSRSNPSKKKGKNSKKKIELKEETRYTIWGIVFFFLALFIILSFFNGAGMAGEFFYTSLSSFFGLGYYLLPILLVIVGFSFVKKGRPQVARLHSIAGAVVLLSSLAIFDISINGKGESTNIALGGYLGSLFAWPFVKLFGVYASLLLLGALLIIALIVLFDERPKLIQVWFDVKRFFTNIFSSKMSLFKKKEEDSYSEEFIDEEYTETQEEETPIVKAKIVAKDSEEEFEEEILIKKPRTKSAYVPPPLSLLERDKGKPNVGDIKANMNIIQRTLMNFGIQVEMDEVTIGPTVTRYALKPAQGMKLSRILGLQNDLALALAAHPIRIEAPIPGKSLVGIEIPNKIKSTVGLATLLSDDKFQNSTKPLTVALGKGLSGKAYFGNLAKMPHALIAGTTGSGKSVTIHSVITSLLYRNGPEEMRMIMVDPKRVELTLYNKIPHLLTPVITDPKKTILSLKWAAKEMDRRYNILESESVRDIESYHQNILPRLEKEAKGKDTEAEKMPYIVIIIDELADIMQAYPRELESAIVRLAQMSRAVGIHLILSTQRPSVNVITGLIKANVPTRIALQVSSQIDSRTILDSAGAEKLLGAGDMLYASGEMSQPERLQSAFISEEEVKKVVQYLRKAHQDDLPNEIELSGPINEGNNLFNGNMEDEDDELYEDARSIVIETGKASTSFLQRKLGIGYARAARLIDILEERGVVGAGNGAKPREVLEHSVDHTNEQV